MGEDQKPLFTEKTKSFSSSPSSLWPLSKLMVSFVALISLSYIFYSLGFMVRSSSSSSPSISPSSHIAISPKPRLGSGQNPEKTDLKHIVFGIAASAKLWKHRKDYVKVWWRPDGGMNGVVWLDKPVENDTVSSSASLLPPIKISSDTSKFKYKYPKGHRSAIRISRVVSETVRLLNGTEKERNVRWIVMGDDDTVFFTENLVRVLRKYDHEQFYYIGSSSESHLQNLHFSYGMAYGGGGFAMSYPLAKALEKFQDRCIERYPELYGSDDRIHACMSELGVPLTREVGFHQFDVYGKLLGLLSAHPVAPIVSVHHLDVVDPIFPNMNRVKALHRLMLPAKLDSASLMQQSVCYDAARNWTVSVSWGYVVLITRGVLPARRMHIPARTFVDWHKQADPHNYAFNTRPISHDTCHRPRVYYVTSALYDPSSHRTASEYVGRATWTPPYCDWEIPDPSEIIRVVVYKRPDPDRWTKAPRRDCCRVLPATKNGTMVLNVGACEDGEIVEFRSK
ncbi:PREDICTED: uncharacterized protein LOC104801400 [Tarenaya hassleriana]|uniref:uncharacterized protein LOC104801400 n=1 Tax=Tarenaya hassleriana TaxID=28532 RepID=UPI00053C5EF9|nr:PREDICTED: uncharacterized protein LOC104801400 [Tarenaya hassleriana]